MYKKIHIAFAIIIIAGFFIRLYQLDEHGIWGDEKASLRNALGIPFVPVVDDTILMDFDQLKNWKELNFSKGEIFTSVKFWSFNTPSNVYKSCFISNNGSILYSFALHYWIRIFGTSDFWVRFLSLVFGCLTVILTFYITNLLFKSYKMALFASALIALHTLFVASSQLTRSHSMAAFFTLLATYFLFRIIQYNKNKLSIDGDEHRIYSIGVWRAGTKHLFIAYTLAVAISLFSHYLTAYVFIGHFLIMILLVRDRGVWINYILANVVVIVIFGLWLYTGGGRGSLETVVGFNNITGEISRNWKKGDNPYFMPATFSNIITCWVQVLLPLFGNYCQSLGFRIRELAVLLFIPLLFLFIGFYRNTDIEKRKLLSALIILSIMFPVFATIVALRYYHLTVFMPAYSVYVAPFAIMLFVYGINKIVNLNKSWKWVFYTLACIQIILNLLSLLPVYSDYWIDRGANPYVVLSDKIKRSYQDKDIIIYPTWADAMFTNIYLKENTNILQMIYTTPHDKVYIFNTDDAGKREIFDFQNGKLRY